MVLLQLHRRPALLLLAASLLAPSLASAAQEDGGAAAAPEEPWLCPRCETVNLGGRSACSACARPLGREEAAVARAGAAARGATGVSAFFYCWYRTPDVDGRWQHWDHGQLPH